MQPSWSMKRTTPAAWLRSASARVIRDQRSKSGSRADHSASWAMRAAASAAIMSSPAESAAANV